jgi:CheY-like chemotaxis protein
MEQVTALLGVMAWPVVVLLSVFLFRKVLRDVLSRDELSFSGPGGLSFSAKRAAGALVDASASKGLSNPLTEAEAEDQVQEVAKFVRRLGRSPRLLWVDDRPSNIRYERSAVEGMGMLVDVGTSTDDAKQKLRQSRRRYDVIISDMARPDDPNAGYTLLRWLRSRDDETPYIIYSSSDSDEHFDEAVRRGAVGSTATPEGVIDMILSSLRAAHPRSRRWRLG